MTEPASNTATAGVQATPQQTAAGRDRSGRRVRTYTNHCVRCENSSPKLHWKHTAEKILLGVALILMIASIPIWGIGAAMFGSAACIVVGDCVVLAGMTIAALAMISMIAEGIFSDIKRGQEAT